MMSVEEAMWPVGQLATALAQFTMQGGARPDGCSSAEQPHTSEVLWGFNGHT